MDQEDPQSQGSSPEVASDSEPGEEEQPAESVTPNQNAQPKSLEPIGSAAECTSQQQVTQTNSESQELKGAQSPPPDMSPVQAVNQPVDDAAQDSPKERMEKALHAVSEGMTPKKAMTEFDVKRSTLYYNLPKRAEKEEKKKLEEEVKDLSSKLDAAHLEPKRLISYDSNEYLGRGSDGTQVYK